jgi:hypothetical protein
MDTFTNLPKKSQKGCLKAGFIDLLKKKTGGILNMDHQIEQWKMCEISFQSDVAYREPFYEAELVCEFTGPEGQKLTRPGFWYGKDVWKVRVALNATGIWSYKTTCTDRSNQGLSGREGQILCEEYSGDLEIYRRGFLKISENNRYFAYADGTPFFYLGDTHWFLPHEKIDRSGVEGVPSQFHYMVDVRVSQGFTVFQSEPLYFANYPHVYRLQDGLDEEDAAGFRLLDEKFDYIADQGLVHANAQLFFVNEINHRAYTPEYLIRLAKYWVARYGAYPVLWTTAQESDPDCYGSVPPEKWFVVAETIANNDAYRHPLTAHMCNSGVCGAHNTAWGKKYYHDWFSLQPGGDMKNTQYMKDIWDYPNPKPALVYETGYENLWNDKDGAIGAGYKAFQFGLCGYGYGAHGVWNDNYDRNDWMDYGGYHRWFEGLNLPGGARLGYMREFYETICWWKLTPCFDDPAWSDFGANSAKITAVIGRETYTVYFFNQNRATGTLRNMLDADYTARWYSVDTGAYTDIGLVRPKSGSLTLPEKPDENPWMLLVSCDPRILSGESAGLFIRSEELKTTLWYNGASVKLSTNRPARFTVTDLCGKKTECAAITEDGELTAKGKNGVVRVTAEGPNGEKACKTMIVLRQDQLHSPSKAQAIAVKGDKDRMTIDAQKHRLQIMPVFTPEDAQDQRVEWTLSAPDGSASPLAYLGEHGMVHAIADGLFRMTARSLDGSGCTGSAVFTIEGHGEASLAAGATVITSDFTQAYGKRTHPARALNGVVDNFSGWCSMAHASCENPVWFELDMGTQKCFNQIDLYTTELGYMLKDFDVQAWVGGEWVTLFSVRDNDRRLQSHRFPEVVAKKIRVWCLKGDKDGNARIDQINVYQKS